VRVAAATAGKYQVINLDRMAILNRVDNVIPARRQNAWTNAKENVPRERNNGKRSSVASSAQLNVRNGSVKAAKMPTSREWYRDRNPVRLSICPEFILFTHSIRLGAVPVVASEAASDT
jgi:hypothetical protein